MTVLLRNHAPHRLARVELVRLRARVRDQDAALRALCDDARLHPADLDEAIRALEGPAGEAAPPAPRIGRLR